MESTGAKKRNATCGARRRRAMVEERQLCKDGPRVSALGFGAWPIGGGMGSVDEATAIATAHAALEAGITLIDTAQAYRGSEALIGRALAGGRRERAFIATKVSRNYTPAGIREAMENSLQALQ